MRNGLTLIEVAIIWTIAIIIILLVTPAIMSLGVKTDKTITIYLTDGTTEKFDEKDFNGNIITRSEDENGTLHVYTRDKSLDIIYAKDVWKKYTSTSRKLENE